MNTMQRLFRSHGIGRCERGAIVVELGLMMPFLAILVVGLLEYAQAIRQSISLEHAARAGAEYALRFPADSSGIQMAVANSGAVDPTNLTVTSSQFCECPDGTSIGCSDTCTSGGTPNAYVQVAVMQPAMDTLQITGLLNGRVISGSAVLRIR